MNLKNKNKLNSFLKNKNLLKKINMKSRIQHKLIC